MNTIPESEPGSVKSTGSMSTFQNDRKRRDNMNDRIQELLTLIPDEYFKDYYNGNDTSGYGGDSQGDKSNLSKTKGTGTRDGKPNKGQILTKAVEYITSLQNEVDLRNREEVELMVKVQKLMKSTGTIVNDINLENTSAEIELSRIGVGPLAGTNTNSEMQDTNGKVKYEYGGYAEYENGG